MITKGKTRGNRLDRPPDFTTLRRPLLRWLDAGVGFCLGGVLAGAELFGLYAPFGVAAVAAAGSGITGFAATLGACLGYLCLEGMTDGMRYAASAILTYSVAFAFYDTRVYRLPWFMPAVAMTLSAMTGIVCRGGQGWYGQDLVYFVTEILLTGAAAACYGVIFARWPQHPSDFRLLTPRQWAGVLMLGATVLMALGRVELLRTFSLGRLLAAVAVMTAARQGVSAGGLTGACAGVALDLASGGTPGCSLLYPLAGVVCGLCHQKKKLPAALAYCAAAFLAILWIREDRSGFGMAMETVMGAILFLLLPLSPWDLAQDKAALAAGRENPGPAVPAGAWRAAAGAFHALREVMETALRPDLPLPPENPAALFTRAADQVCARCVLRQTCWQKDYESTKTVLTEATGPAMARGRALATDFAGHFSARCVHFPAFLGEVNRQLTAFLRRRQTLWQTRQTRRTLLLQYARLDTLLDRAARTAAARVPDGPRQEALTAWLWGKDLTGGAVYRDENDRLRVEIPYDEALTGKAVRRELSALLDAPLADPVPLGDRLHFPQAPPLRALPALASAPRKGETVSGDTAGWFRRGDGTLFLLLCDGMGSGPEAQKESRQSYTLIRRFLEAGMDPAQALETVSSALSLRGIEGGTTSVDLLCLDPYAGTGAIYKQGASPSYLRQEDRLRCAVGSSLPAGLAGGEAPAPHTFRAGPGTLAVLVSDGIACGKGDGWLRALLTDSAGSDPQKVADAILQISRRETGGEDDGTVMVLSLTEAAD